VHEFAHAIHHMGLNSIDATFNDELERLYAEAQKKGLWKDKYAGTNPAEYWAEGVQSYFGNNRQPDHDHNHVDTRPELEAYDPGLAGLIDHVFRGSTWQFKWLSERASAGHLRGYNRSKAPTFSWPEHLSKEWWKNMHQKASSRRILAISRAFPPSQTRDIFLLNQSDEARDVHWVGYDEKPFLITDADKKPLQIF
jgi:hypothetical protein